MVTRRFYGWRQIGLAVLGVGLMAGCGGGAGRAEDAIQVTVSIPPQKYFVERIGGDRVRVEVMVGRGESPATYEPKPSQLRALSSSAVYFRIGVPFEDAWVSRLGPLMEGGEIVNVAEGQADLVVHHAHGHGHEAGAHEEGRDPHTWLSPRLAAGQAAAVCRALCRVDPDHAGFYEANLAALEAEIAALDQELAERLAGLAGRRFLVFHPSWGYFARDYGLEQVAMEVGGQEPSAQELAALVSRAEAEGIRVVFVQPEFDTSKAETLAASLGGRVIRVSPLAEDWAENLRRMAAALPEAAGP